MKSKLVASFVVASLVGTSIAAFAQPHRDDRRGPSRGPARSAPPRPMPMRDAHNGPIRDADRGRPGGPIPHSDWHRGDRLPAEYRDRNYVVDDWRAHGLSAPPRGYHWLGVNGDYVLAAVATGVIASVLISAH